MVLDYVDVWEPSGSQNDGCQWKTVVAARFRGTILAAGSGSEKSYSRRIYSLVARSTEAMLQIMICYRMARCATPQC